MKTPAVKPFSDRDFHDRLHDLIEDRAARITLMHSDGRHLHEIFTVGTGSGAPTRIFDHVGGFYLVGEGITLQMLTTIHSLFSRYCRAHDAVVDAERHNPIHVQLRSFAEHGNNRLCMHFPITIGKFHPPLE